MSNNLLPKPSKAQYDILNDKAKCKLVIASPGSGKTTLLLQAIQQYYKNNNGNCLFISYSRMSTADNSDKVQNYFANHQQNIRVQTFDSFCNNIITQHWRIAGYSKKPVFGNAFDQELLNVSYNEFVKREVIDENIAYAEVIRIIENSILKQCSIKQSINELFNNHYLQHTKYLSKVRRHYLECRRRHGIFYYNEQVFECYRLLNQNDELLKLVTDCYSLVLIDEIQDMSPEQLKIAMLLSQSAEQTVLVGDDAQCIFTFRGVAPTNFKKIIQCVDGCKEFFLTLTYRCTNPIAHLASMIRNQIEDVKTIRMDAIKEGSKPTLIGFQNQRAQYTFVAKHILELNKTDSAYSDIAIIARKHESLCQVQRLLQQNKIPFKTKYTADEEVTLEGILNIVITLYKLFSSCFETELVQVIFDFLKIDQLSENFDYVRNELLSRKKKATSHSNKHLKLFGNFIRKMSYADSLETKIVFITEFVWQQFKKDKKYYFQSHLTHVNLLARNIADENELMTAIQNIYHEDDVAVTLLTAHASKGLEFGVVFIIDADDCNFPFQYSKKHFDAVNNERKLFYVAISRCKHTLIICSQDHEQVQFTNFITDLEDYTKLVDVSYFVDASTCS